MVPYFPCQEGEPIGSSILQLVVTDRDTPQNGPPFTFHIVSGNEDRHFHVDQGGLLSISAPLKKKIKPQHLLKIQVTNLPVIKRIPAGKTYLPGCNLFV